MARKKKKIKNMSSSTMAVGIIVFLFTSIIVSYQERIFSSKDTSKNLDSTSYALADIPAYNGDSFIILNNNIPNFKEEDYLFNGEVYSELDSLNRCGIAMAKVGVDTMPSEERGSIGMIKPSGWHTVRYDIVSGKYLYNRCHLIGYQLTGENANSKNLITCTRFMNTIGMLEFENKVASYVKATNNHVLYRVTPDFKEDNLLVNGVQIEAESIEDNGAGIRFNVYIYNVQDGIEIDYKTGESKLMDVSN